MKNDLISREDIIVRLMQKIDGIGQYGYTSEAEIAFADGMENGLELAIEVINAIEATKDMTSTMLDFLYGKTSIIVDGYNWRDFAEEVIKQDPTLRWPNGKELLSFAPADPNTKFAITVYRSPSGSRCIMATIYEADTVNTDYHLYVNYEDIEE